MERPFARQSFPLALRTSMGTQGGSLVGDHAWETSFGESDRNDRQNTSHFSNPSSPKTIALFMKRSTKMTQNGDKGKGSRRRAPRRPSCGKIAAPLPAQGQ